MTAPACNWEMWLHLMSSIIQCLITERQHQITLKHIDVCNTTMDLTFFKQQGVTGMSLRVFEISQLLNTRSSTQSSASVVTINRVFVFCFLYVTLFLSRFNIPNSIHFNYLATLWMVLNWYPGVVNQWDWGKSYAQWY